MQVYIDATSICKPTQHFATLNTVCFSDNFRLCVVTDFVQAIITITITTIITATIVIGLTSVSPCCEDAGPDFHVYMG